MRLLNKKTIFRTLCYRCLSDFARAVKKLTKLETLNLIEYTSGQGIARHIIINKMRGALER